MVRDRNNEELKVGDCVRWYDPDEETRDLTRLWGIDKINGDDDDSIILISDDFSEAEVWGCELEKF